MREIELDLFSLMHPRVVADDDDDGRASILIVFLFFFLPLFISPFFSPPTFFQSSAAPATSFFLSFFPLILCPYPSSSPWWSPRCHYTNSTTGTTHSRSACVSMESSSIVLYVRTPTPGRNDGWFLLPGWLGLYKLLQPSSSRKLFYFLLRPAFSAAGVLLRAFDIITWKGLPSFCCQFFSSSSYTLNWGGERDESCTAVLFGIIVSCSLSFIHRPVAWGNKQTRRTIRS